MILALLFSAHSAYAQTHWLTSDFFVTKSVRSERSRPATARDCRAEIRKAVCMVDVMSLGPGGKPLERPCLPGGENYAATFEELHDRFPPHLQKMFCSLRRIFIEKEFFATAYAGTIIEPDGKVNGALMGVRKDFLDRPLTIGFWSSWKEQLNFGGDPKRYAVDASMPLVHSSSPDMLYFVVAHEFGHIFDFTNQLNRFIDCKFDENGMHGTCSAAPGSWSELGWSDFRGHTRPGNDFALRKELCFYWCNGQFIDPARASELYTGLFMTNFPSIYGASNPYDDFAETLAYYSIDRHLQATYAILTPDGGAYDAISHLRSPRMADKVLFLEKFLNASPAYP